MSQKKLMEFVAKGKRQQEARKQKWRDLFLEEVDRETFDFKCPHCLKELAPFTIYECYKAYRIDEYLWDFMILTACGDCGKFFITPKREGDPSWEEFRNSPELLQAIAEMEDYKMKCPNYDCRKEINLAELKWKDVTETMKGIVFQCSYCKRLILISQEKVEKLKLRKQLK